MQNFFWAGNLKFLRERKKLTQEELAANVGMGRAKLAAHEGGKAKNPPLEDLIRISDFFKIAIDPLVRLDLAKLGELKLRDLEAGNEVYASGKALRILPITVTPDNKDQVEMVSLKAKAGYAAGYGDPDFIASLPVFHMPQLPKDKKFRMFPVSGDSMLPVPEGAYVIVEYVQDWNLVKDGTPCIIISKNDGIVFKIVQNRLKEDRSLTLISLNPLYKSYNLKASEIIEVWKYHSYWTDGKLEPSSGIDQILKKIDGLQQEIKSIMKTK